MALDGKQLKQIYDALLDGYDESGLRQMVLFELNEKLDRIAGGEDLEERVLNLVEWARRTGRVDQLVQGAYAQNPGNEMLRALHEGWSPLPGAPEDSQATATAGGMSPQIFLSYSRNDSQLMRQLLDVLVDAGFSVWTDDGLEAGTSHWQAEIERAIQRTQCMVVILTPEAKQSRWVDIEVSYALRLEKRVFPLLARGSDTEAVLLSLFNTQWIDVRSDYVGAAKAKLLPALRRHLLPGDAGATEDAATQPAGAATEGHRALPLPGRGVSRWLATVGALVVVGAVVWYAAVNYGREPAAGPPTGAEVEPAATITKTREVRPSPSPVTGTGDESSGSKGAPVDVWVNPVDGAEYALVPAGPFVMGSDLTADGLAQGYEERELPQRVLELGEFWLMRTEVTNGQYARCKAAGPCTAPGNDEWQLPGYANRPVTNVSWEQANDYAAWVGGRLPTEAEWEKACRGTAGGIYPWGDAMPSAQRLNYNSNLGRTEDVASYPPGKYGLYDMAGNVWEWTASQYAAYPYDPEDGREDPATVTDPVTRGGAFGASPAVARCAFRNSEVGGKPDPFVGFRVALAGGGE